jgi:hypothetical protein
MANVFVSYSRQDIEFARKLVEWLEKKGHRVWMDKKRILGGADYREEIADGISSADVFISLLSPDSVTSKWVKREIYYADDKDKFIIPVLVKFVEFPQEFQLALTGVHYVDLTAASSKYDPWSELERALEKAKVGAPLSEAIHADKPPYKGLQAYMAKKSKRKISLRLGPFVAALVLVLAIGLFWGRYSKSLLPEPNEINVSAVTTEVRDAIRLVYTTPLEEAAPSAAVAVMVQKTEDSAWHLLRDGEELPSGANYFFGLHPEENAYFYIFQIDSTGKLDWLFPQNTYLFHSTGQNPVSAAKWTRVPLSVNQAYYLDENVGVEHFYIVATKTPWSALEEALGKAGLSGDPNKPILASFSLQTRGSAGIRPVPVKLPGAKGQALPGAQQLIKGKAGALVIERWFQHINAKAKE